MEKAKKGERGIGSRKKSCTFAAGNKKLQKMKRLLLALLLTGAVTAKAQTAAFDYNEMDCGPELTTFRCLAPAQAKSVVVRLYQNAEGGKALKTVKMKKTDGTDDNGCAVWQTAVKGRLPARSVQPFASASLKCMSQSVGTFSPSSTRIYHSYYIRECNFVF